MSRIYIAYRSIDSHQKAIQKLYARLTETYGDDHVTLSSQDASLDTNIRQAQVRAHDVLLVIFGRYGLNMVDERGNRLIDDPYDAQHIEISAGLKQKLQIHTLVFDDMVEDLSKHIPEVLSGLTNKPVILNVTNATMPETIESLIDDIGEAKQQIPVSKADLSKMVIQPSSKRVDTQVVHLPEPVRVEQSPPEPEIYIHQSRNPVIRFFQRIGQQMTGQYPTQSEVNNRPDGGHPRVESYRQMWPTSFLIIAFVIALSVFVAAMLNTDIPNSHDAQFSLREVATMGRGGTDIAFSSDGTQVAHITTSDAVYHFNWQTTSFPDRLEVRMRSPKQVAYDMNDMLIMRNDSRIFVVDTREYGGYIAHQYAVEYGATIVDMAVSQVSPVIVFILDTGEIVRWDYGAGDVLQKSINFYVDITAQIILSDEHNVMVVLNEYHSSAWMGQSNSLDGISTIYTSMTFKCASFDNDEAVFLGCEHREDGFTHSLADLSYTYLNFARSDFAKSTLDDFVYDETANHLIQVYDDTNIRIWHIDDNSRYLGEYDLFDFGEAVIQSIALSPDGRYLATTTLTDTVIWELEIED